MKSKHSSFSIILFTLVIAVGLLLWLTPKKDPNQTQASHAKIATRCSGNIQGKANKHSLQDQTQDLEQEENGKEETQ